jgi:hypothetical protein
VEKGINKQYLNMKTMKFLIGMIAAVLISSAASAQHSSSPRGKVNLGIKGGINLYKISSDDNIVYDQITGFHLGLLGGCWHKFRSQYDKS